MRKIVTVGLGVLFLWVVAPLFAGPLEDGVAAQNKGDYATALRLLRLLADQGQHTAQVSLGFMYANGQGVPQNFAEAVKWYRLAADKGDVGGQNNLGSMHANGQGVRQNFTEAMKWYSLAADQGDATAQYNLGFMYANGQGAPQDYVEAAKWFRKAADQPPTRSTTSARCTAKVMAWRRTMRQ
jgi:TPR repeat protein